MQDPEIEFVLDLKTPVTLFKDHIQANYNAYPPPNIESPLQRFFFAGMFAMHDVIQHIANSPNLPTHAKLDCVKAYMSLLALQTNDLDTPSNPKTN